ncbi:MAG: hypothetical protein ACSW8B_01620 [bacterium]
MENRRQTIHGRMLVIMNKDGSIDHTYQAFTHIMGTIVIFASRTYHFRKMFITFLSDDQRWSFKTTPGVLTEDGDTYTLVTDNHIYVFEEIHNKLV